MRIDLHCHTKKCKKGDPKTRNVDANTFVQKVSDAGVGIVAITNHNHFDRRQFDEFSDEAADSFLLWPGIELDVNNPNTGNKWHMLVVANPTDIDLFCQRVSKLIGDTLPDAFQCD
ncbi:MAG: PHP domain-containing protein, partial [Prevotella sp.]